MNIYIWSRVDNLTDSYHREGGVVVIAGSIERAIELIKDKAPECTASDDNLDHKIISDVEDKERVWIFPDSGCC